ncbi:MAG: exodeoxyribonuclease I [Gammaproteobacteria bacterium]|nr:exodeoxyribonuclease I [Gammaproteobacteria bacterium]
MPTSTLARAPTSIYWYDLETSGTHPASDRIMQFAGCRTDAELHVIDDPYVTYVSLAADVLPHPEACLVTRITPQRANREGIDEWQAIRRIDEIMRVPGTCVAGYNNLRFDDEFLRNALYRNLTDPYAREWQEGNSRWDLIDLVRATCALRPDGIVWPEEDGVVSFGLERLCVTNGIAQDDPHDAMSDVEATIGLARLIRKAQPRLWDYALGRRFRNAAGALLLPLGQQTCIHVSNRFPNARFCAAPVASVAMHPQIDTRMIVADLAGDITPLVEWSSGEIAERLFADELAEGDERPPLKVVVMNRCPFLAPISVVRPGEAPRLMIDLDEVEEKRRVLAARQPELATKIAEVYRPKEERAPAEDPELALYDGFSGDADRFAMKRLARTLDEDGPWPDFQPRDKRLSVLAERLKARLRPDELSGGERGRWRQHVQRCLDDGFGNRPCLAAFRAETAKLLAEETDPARRQVLTELASYEPDP